MATIESQITAVRYDLRDEDITQYPDDLLLNYYNRVLPPLASHLASIRSDWVFEDTTLTITSGDNYVALPDLFASPIAVEIDDSPLILHNVRDIKKFQQKSSSGTPERYGVHKLNMIFERAVSADTSVYVQYNEKETALAAGASMPYNDEFNEVLLAAVVMIAKNRNEKDITGDYALQTVFNDSAHQRVVRRSFKQHKNLGF